jgi:hypothetical protein
LSPLGQTAQRVQGQVRHAPRDLERGPEALAHVVVDLVDRAAADRVVRVVAQQLAPGEPQLPARMPEAGSREERQRAQGLGARQLPLAALVRLLQVHARGVDPAQHVRLRPAGQLAGERG